MRVEETIEGTKTEKLESEEARPKGYRVEAGREQFRALAVRQSQLMWCCTQAPLRLEFP